MDKKKDKEVKKKSPFIENVDMSDMDDMLLSDESDSSWMDSVKNVDASDIEEKGKRLNIEEILFDDDDDDEFLEF